MALQGEDEDDDQWCDVPSDHASTLKRLHVHASQTHTHTHVFKEGTMTVTGKHVQLPYNGENKTHVVPICEQKPAQKKSVISHRRMSLYL